MLYVPRVRFPHLHVGGLVLHSSERGQVLQAAKGGGRFEHADGEHVEQRVVPVLVHQPEACAQNLQDRDVFAPQPMGRLSSCQDTIALISTDVHRLYSSILVLVAGEISVKLSQTVCLTNTMVACSWRMREAISKIKWYEEPMREDTLQIPQTHSRKQGSMSRPRLDHRIRTSKS